MAINSQSQSEVLDFLNEAARGMFYKTLEREMKDYIEKNKDRIISEVILSIGKSMSMERFGKVVRFEINTDHK